MWQQFNSFQEKVLRVSRFRDRALELITGQGGSGPIKTYIHKVCHCELTASIWPFQRCILGLKYKMPIEKWRRTKIREICIFPSRKMLISGQWKNSCYSHIAFPLLAYVMISVQVVFQCRIFSLHLLSKCQMEKSKETNVHYSSLPRC